MQIYSGKRQSGKSTMLIERSEKSGAIIIAPTYPMVDHLRLLAAQMGKKIPTPITISNYIQMHGLISTNKYLIDELQLVLSIMNIEAATVDCDCVEALRRHRKKRRKSMNNETATITLKKIVDCEGENGKYYLELPDGYRLIYDNDGYVGRYNPILNDVI